MSVNINAEQSTPRQQKIKNNIVQLGFWTAMWLLTIALTKFGPQFIWYANITLTTISVLLNLALGLKMVMVNVQHLKSLDELQQRIQLYAMGITLGISLVVGLTISNLDVLEIIDFHAEISHLVIFIGLTYLCVTLIGNRHYR